jgi:ribosomal-protein-alanine N-acetyltransferase
MYSFFLTLYYCSDTYLVRIMSDPRILIRRAHNVDVPAIAAIELESFPDPWDQNVFYEAITYFPTGFFVASCNGEVIGFITGGIEDTGEQLYGHICNLAVAGPYRRLGVGALLVGRLEQQFRFEMASGVQLEVRVSNFSAQQFYKRLSYREVFRIDRYYANGEDAIIMMKWFRF